MKIPTKLANWIRSFLQNRKFYIQIDNISSSIRTMETGLSQGAILSPILFLIFINDIPNSVPNYLKNESILFADDLFSFYFDKNLNRIRVVMQHYLNLLENWFRIWRLKTSGQKCSYNIYQKHEK